MSSENKKNTSGENQGFSRRSFLEVSGLSAMALGVLGTSCAKKTTTATQVAPPVNVAGFERAQEEDPSAGWEPFSTRKVRVGLVGYGVCKFAADFSFQHHPNVEVVAVSDLFPDRCAELARVTNCKKTYPSLEEMVKDDNIEAIFCATDAPSHARHAMLCLNHGKHVAVAVPATFGSIEEGEQLLETVKKNKGLKYMMFETSCFRENLYAMRQIYMAGGFGKILYSEGEYWHYSPPGPGIGSYKEWRKGSPPMWYPTHNTAYYVGVTDQTFTEVSCLGVPGTKDVFRPGANAYGNPFATEIAIFRTSEGGISRQSRCSATAGHNAETGRVRGEKGSYYDSYDGIVKDLPNLKRPPLPPGVIPGGHGGSHGRLTDEFIRSIIEDRKPLVDVVAALNMTIPGIIAHQSALKGGEWLKIPQYSL